MGLSQYLRARTVSPTNRGFPSHHHTWRWGFGHCVTGEPVEGSVKQGVAPESTQQLKGRLHSPDHVFRTSTMACSNNLLEQTNLDAESTWINNLPRTWALLLFQTRPYGVGDPKTVALHLLCSNFSGENDDRRTDSRGWGVYPVFGQALARSGELRNKHCDMTSPKKRRPTSQVCLWKSGMGQSSREDNK